MSCENWKSNKGPFVKKNLLQKNNKNILFLNTLLTKNRQKYDLSIPKPNDFSLYAL